MRLQDFRRLPSKAISDLVEEKKPSDYQRQRQNILRALQKENENKRQRQELSEKSHLLKTNEE